MLGIIEDLSSQVKNFRTKNKEEIEKFRIAFLGKKGCVTELFEKFKQVPPEQKKEFGQKINLLKQAVNAKIEELKIEITEEEKVIEEDLTKPGYKSSKKQNN